MITRSWEKASAPEMISLRPPVPVERRREIVWLLAASVIVGCALLLAATARTRDFPASRIQLDQGLLVDLNSVTRADSLSPALQAIAGSEERQEAGEQIWQFLQHSRPLANVGALARLRTRPLLPLGKIKPMFVVRTPREFWLKFGIWIGVYFAAFYVVHLLWRLRRFNGDAAILPALHLLTGMGLTLAVSLRDPLRDTMEFSKYSWGVALGCAFLLLPLLRSFDYRRFSDWVYTPLFAAFGLFGLLLRLGTGPAGSSAKVNLGPFQPVELIKILLVLFMAGYFARKWEWLRELRERRLVPGWLQWTAPPRAAHALPVICAVALGLMMFFVLKDLGPALVTGFLFLTMFAIARNRAGLAILGIVLLVGGVAIGYHIGKPPTVAERISMWQSPWDNDVRGGDQLAHSFWAISTGGPWGSGPGSGDPEMIPAGHTDLVLPAIAEEWGFAGVLAILLLFAWLFYRAVRLALAADSYYGVFLILGLSSLIALEMLLISGGVLGLVPLSGVVSPFLSSGNTAMLANFLIFGLILAVSSRAGRRSVSAPFAAPAKMVALVFGICALMLAGKAAWIGVFNDTDYFARDVRVYAADGVKRPQHNPRLNSLARELTRGDVLDRNGVLLATSQWSAVEQRRAEYEKLGAAVEKNCSALESRHYPFGPATVQLLGDLRTGERFHATNASLIEHDQNAKLQGFKDYSELAGVIRYRHQPGDPGMARLRARDRTVHASIDIRLQLRALDILNKRLGASGKKGAAVVLDAQSGDVLAALSVPLPAPGEAANEDQLFDRARYGQYPPGSTFKLVTAVAALRSDPNLIHKRFTCRRLSDGRAGTEIPGWRRPIRDDIGDAAHGTIELGRAITVSCNAYFAQLGVGSVGAKRLRETAGLFEVPVGNPDELARTLPFASYGQGMVLITPFKMARVAATIASNGSMPQGRWVLDESNTRRQSPKPILDPALSAFLAGAMRSVVVAGTARRAMAGLDIPVAGKTGTAQMNDGAPHGWFAGFAPYSQQATRRIAFAVLVEHGGYGGQAAAPIARELVEAARELGIISGGEK